MSAPIIVGLSGGVDSSVAALLLLEQGHEVEALFMKNWEEDDDADYCAAAEDLADAQAVADRLGIRLRTVNFAAEYWDRVFDHFLQEYRALRTPNPDVLCNREIKFKAFLDYALALGAQGIATGHYARVGEQANRHTLLRGLDTDKDQSYFLYLLGQRALAHSRFPLGELAKPEVRALAARAGFPNHKKKDSTGICFIGERRFKDFLQRYIPAQPGPIETDAGEPIGEHQGLMYYTLGQRQGLGIGGVRGARSAPWFVIDKRVADNTLVVAQQHDHERLMHRALIASHLHWIGETAPRPSQALSAKVRYRQADQACRMTPLDDATLRVDFDEPQRAITAGQSVVFYCGQQCLGGGIIQSAKN